MTKSDLFCILERSPVIAAVRDENFETALTSSAEIIFYLKANLLTVKKRVSEAINSGKIIFIHIDLAEGIAKDQTGIKFLANIGVHGIISTRSHLIKNAKDEGLLTVQRFFALDSQGLNSVREIIGSADFIEIMPGVIPKVIEEFVKTSGDIIAGGLIETKDEVITALKLGATAVSTGKTHLWEL
ncbi:MAG: glycerol-3-phosphate responsive antiterminator [Clostridia bacterium]|nr:glycerol-3-phosphate responsive antiterminator [Clostridia bacterium]